ncbi:rod shape-determining protein MreC [Candidatus Berkelbacteria bacterium]|nr:rod shape-determining protein MreC [Candidatus Berkelbacteria bacterium]MBI2588354.1 rod shape-determining protein MreC [Candidatus Berkelbacteria bacterium]MBI4029820.1 rod shape-determining protein MreC [Candidatus Berkelbacteria bacterium]
MPKLRLFIIFFVISVFLFWLDKRGLLFWPKTILSLPIFKTAEKIESAWQKIDEWGQIFSSLSSIASENQKLKEKNISLEAEVAYQRQLLSKVKLLEDEEALSATLKKDYRLSKVIGRSPLGSFGYLVLDNGSKQNIKVGSLVTFQGYLVAEVKEIMYSQSVAWLISNPNLRLPVVLEKSREKGLLAATLSGLVVEDVPADAAVEEGEFVFTSNVGGRYPEGILIGKVEKVEKEKAAIFQTLSLKQPFNLNRLEVVTIWL